MPINPNIPEAFIAAYSHIHHPQHTQSFTESVTSTAYELFGKMTPAQKTQSCKDIINRFKPDLTAHEWIELTYALGESAREHQLDKIKPLQKTIDPSHFSKAIHAARSYIVACLSSDAAYQTTYQTTLAELNAALCEQDKRIAENRRLIKVDVSTLCDHRNLLLVKLAYLGDEAALDRCIDYGLFDYMPRVNNHHRMNQPICMEKNYFVTYYEKELHAELNKNLQSTIRNLQDFIDGAINRTLLFKLTLHNEEKIQSKLNLGLVPVVEAPKAEPKVEGEAPKLTITEEDNNASSTEELRSNPSPSPSPTTSRVGSPVSLFPPKPSTPPLEGGAQAENKLLKQ